MISENIRRLPLRELTEMEHRYFEMALLALNVGNYEDCERYSNYGFELDKLTEEKENSFIAKLKESGKL